MKSEKWLDVILTVFLLLSLVFLAFNVLISSTYLEVRFSSYNLSFLETLYKYKNYLIFIPIIAVVSVVIRTIILIREKKNSREKYTSKLIFKTLFKTLYDVAKINITVAASLFVALVNIRDKMELRLDDLNNTGIYTKELELSLSKITLYGAIALAMFFLIDLTLKVSSDRVLTKILFYTTIAFVMTILFVVQGVNVNKNNYTDSKITYESFINNGEPPLVRYCNGSHPMKKVNNNLLAVQYFDEKDASKLESIAKKYDIDIEDIEDKTKILKFNERSNIEDINVLVEYIKKEVDVSTIKINIYVDGYLTDESQEEELIKINNFLIEENNSQDINSPTVSMCIDTEIDVEHWEISSGPKGE